MKYPLSMSELDKIPRIRCIVKPIVLKSTFVVKLVCTTGILYST